MGAFVPGKEKKSIQNTGLKVKNLPKEKIKRGQPIFLIRTPGKVPGKRLIEKKHSRQRLRRGTERTNPSKEKRLISAGRLEHGGGGVIR